MPHLSPQKLNAMQNCAQPRPLLLLPLLLILSTAQAQRPHGAGHAYGFDPEQQTEQMAKNLDLRPDQIPQVRDINRQTAEKIKTARDSGGRSYMRTKMQAIFEEQDKAIQVLLSAEQWKKYQSMKQERRRGRP